MKALCFEDDNKEGTETKSYLDNKRRDRKEAPRIGDQYQAEIPSLITEPRICQSVKISRDSDKTEAVSLKLRIPLIRPHCKLKSSFEILESVTTPRGSNLLPGLLSAPSWTEVERNSFLLGLYAFGKNLNTVKRFVGSKSMGEILSFYYGKFHRSEGYCRWSKCRKWRSNRRIYGQKIFIGWRQQELLSRLSSQVSKECQITVVELTGKFAEGKMRFQDYLFALKDAVGIDQLVVAVGVGKGKKDLTISKKTQIKHNNSVKQKMQKVKNCISSTDIVKLLKGGDLKLNKDRSNNLFWKDVWPRLVAKGWHSEQYKDGTVSGSKQSSVFLIPGIKKFSRAKLQKGNHYFDSISDVLKKVASDPRLLEMEAQANEKSIAKKKLKQEKQALDGNSTKHQVSHPRIHSSKRQDPMKFTIVDTTIVSDSDKHKGRKPRISTFRTLSMSTISSYSSGSEQGASHSQEIEDQAEQTSSSNLVKESSDKRVKIESPDYTVNNYEEQEPSKEINKYRFVQNVISDCSKYSRPIVKKPKLAMANHGEYSDCTVSTSVDKKLDSNESSSQSYHCGESESIPDMINEGNDVENHRVREIPGEETKIKTKMLLDLNLPLIEPDLEVKIEVPSSMIMQQNNDNQCENVPCFPSEVTQINEIEEFSDGHEEQKPIIVNRRQSTRNRPLTRKALEALESRFVNSKRKRKNLESSQNNSKSQGDDSIDNPMPYIGVEKENVIKEYSSSINLGKEDIYDM
ncbi:hypothetical protein HN51_023323 [Arachis hypogaea]|uniref:uncharacterized protein n=1 Tax=Arachis hypogaea TaxID=3818 RepID=UPI000DECD9AB|nr:uncharacterized protein LOC112755707 [Arachis hypogaea]